MTTRSTLGTALVTGASSGIGATYADRLARRGYDLILVARDRSRLQQLAKQLSGLSGVKAEVLRADLTVPAELRKVEERLRTDQSITALVNNAGITAPRQIVGADPDRLELAIQLNIVAVTRLAAAAASGFATRGTGTIINVASVLALAPEITSGVYSGSKAYVLNFSQSLHQELNASGVRVQAVLPGLTRTELWERSGIDVNTLPQDKVMSVGELVDAALAGLDQGELVSIPSLPDVADWNAFELARLNLGPNLSHRHAATRYNVHESNAA
ncbi:MAG TPA: SDR family oxidoreductase [Steroidobacteraceae bacterium]|nr:SDR family oxidoreductase [Steroidobacteraceae bacterium]